MDYSGKVTVRKPKGIAMESKRAIHLSTMFITVFLLLAFPITGRAIRAIPNDNLAYPVLITHEAGGTGTGFYLSTDKYIYLVTARHILFNDESPNKPRFTLKSNSIKLLSYPHDPKERGKIVLKMDLKSLNNSGNLRYHRTRDVAIVRVARKIKSEDQRTFVKTLDGVKITKKTTSGIIGVNISSLKKYEQVLTANEVFIFGYPTSLGIKNIPQIDYLKPLLRKGIVAGKNDKEKTIIIDCPSYPGNSGGPVLEVEQVGLGYNFNIIGIVSEFIPFAETWKNVTHGYKNLTISNSGYSVVTPIDVVHELIWD